MKRLFIHNKKTIDVINNHIQSHRVKKCNICEIIFSGEGTLKQHWLNEHGDQLTQLNCNLCSFQSSRRKEFMNHVPKHGVSDQTESVQIEYFKCKDCGNTFINRRSLMDHRRDNYDMPMCFFDMEDRCTQLPGKCWYKHKAGEPSGAKVIICFTCQQTFDSIGILMDHR